MLRTLVLVIFWTLQTKAAEPVLRIFCHSEVLNPVSTLKTLRSNVIPDFLASDIVFYDENQKTLKTIYAHQPWINSKGEMQVFVLGLNRRQETKLYLFNVSIPDRKAVGRPIADSRSISAEVQSTVESRKIHVDALALNKNYLAFPGKPLDEYVLYDLTQNTFRSIKVRKNSTNPRFSISSDNLFFDVAEPATSISRPQSRVSQIAYSLTSNKISFESRRTQEDELFLEYNPIHSSWFSLKVKADKALLVETDAHGNSVTRRDLDLFAAKLPLSYFLKDFTFNIVWNEYKWQEIKDDDGIGIGLEFTQAAVQQLIVSAAGATELSFPYSSALKKLVSRHSSLDLSFMKIGFIAPNSNEYIISLGNLAGLTKVNLTNGSWEQLAVGGASRCLNPKWTYEGVR